MSRMRVSYVYKVRKCRECGIEFQPKRDKQDFCSQKCVRKFFGRMFFGRRR